MIRIRMQILHFDPMYTGAAGPIKTFIKYLPSDKVSFEIVTSWVSGTDRIENRERYRIVRLGNGYANEIGRMSALGKLSFAFAAFNYHRRNPDYDLLHFHGGARVAIPSLMIARMHGKPIVQKYTRYGDDDPTTMSQTFLGRLTNRLFSYAGSHIVTSPQLLESCEKQYSRSIDCVDFIPNPVDSEFWAPINEEQKHQLRSALNLNPRGYHLVFVGTLSKTKGVDLLTELWDSQPIGYHLHLVGPFSPDIPQNCFSKYVHSSNVHLHGCLDKLHIRDLLRASDGFLFPTRREGLPNALLEAMSCGCSIIARALPGVTDFLLGKSGERGYLVAGDNSYFWWEAIRAICTKKQGHEIGYNARKWILENASAHVVARKMLSVYNRLIENRNKFNND